MLINQERPPLIREYPTHVLERNLGCALAERGAMFIALNRAWHRAIFIDLVERELANRRRAEAKRRRAQLHLVKAEPA